MNERPATVLVELVLKTKDGTATYRHALQLDSFQAMEGSNGELKLRINVLGSEPYLDSPESYEDFMTRLDDAGLVCRAIP